MNAQEAASLCRFAKAACPQQAIDEHTPTAWALLLDDVTFEDAKTALVAVVKRQPFVAPAEIRAEVKRMRAKRIAEAPAPLPPPGLDARQTNEWLRRARQAIGDGEVLPEAPGRGELIRKPIRELRMKNTDDTEETP